MQTVIQRARCCALATVILSLGMNESSALPIVLIHGLIGSLDESAIAAELKPHPVLAPPLLGYGENAGAEPATIHLHGQAEHVYHIVREHFGIVPVHVVGHSVGGVVACLLARNHPDHVSSVLSVEGNFTLRDAFWSASIGRMAQTEAEAMLEGFRTDPSGWVERAGVAPTPERLRVVSRWLANQPASTLRAMGRSVVEVTGAPSYDVLLHEVFRQVPVHLVAGERSRAGWDVPSWALEQAASVHIVPSSGHMMMLEDPQGFGRLIRSVVSGVMSGTCKKLPTTSS